MNQSIEAPSNADIDAIAQYLLYAKNLIRKSSGIEPTGDESDLHLIQSCLDSLVNSTENIYEFQALGLWFGKVFLENNAGYDWWMVEDEHGRDPTIRWQNTTLLIFPQTMLSKRIEDGVNINIVELYHALCSQVKQIQFKKLNESEQYLPD